MTHPTKSTLAIKRLLLLLLLISCATVLLIKGISTSSIAQSSEERELVDEIPKHLPIKIKLKKEKEKAFKDLKNEKWARDLEIEVTNTGNKPIYYIDLLLVFPETADRDGRKVGYPLRYGRIDLVDLKAEVQPDDIPLKPGESYIFKLSALDIKGWEKFSEHNNRPQPKKVLLRFRVLNFGDGTGFMWSDGAPFPREQKRKISEGRCIKGNAKPPGIEKRLLALNHSFNPPSQDNLQASFLPANFLSIGLLNPFPIEPSPQPDICCPGTSCSFLIIRPTQCYCGDTFEVTSPLSCSDPFGRCGRSEWTTRWCYDDYLDTLLGCPEADLIPCDSSMPTPTPTPTPTTSPTPCPLRTDCGSIPDAISADPCRPDNLPGTNCPIGYTQSENCCLPVACPEPTPTPSPCNGDPHWVDAPVCNWVCLPPLPSPSPTPRPVYHIETYCVAHFLVTDYGISYDGGQTWLYWYSTREYIGYSCNSYPTQ